jgi:hypothetical protein
MKMGAVFAFTVLSGVVVFLLVMLGAVCGCCCGSSSVKQCNPAVSPTSDVVMPENHKRMIDPSQGYQPIVSSQNKE